MGKNLPYVRSLKNLSTHKEEELQGEPGAVIKPGGECRDADELVPFYGFL